MPQQMPTKAERYRKLVEARKKCQACSPGLRNPAEEGLSEFDSPDHIGPWTRLDSDLDAGLMVVGQDWADVGYYTRHRGLDKDNDPANNATNRNLEKLLKVADADTFAAPLIFDAKPRGLFLTNAVLCLIESRIIQ